ncbi:hypothetical protein SRHO_G00182450 [Serrasalmus rhombeus]
MKRLRPSTDNISSIKAAMQKTFTWRRSWIAKHSPSLSEIFEEYPRFLDMPTLLDTEFGKMYEEKGDLFLRRWEATIIPKLKAIGIMETGDLASLIKDMEHQNEGLTCAVDKLFKLYWVCNLAYPCQLSSVFCFFEHIYDMPLSTNRKAKPGWLSKDLPQHQIIY